MTRRIALALVLLTAAVLVAAGVPLALGAIAHERDAFVQDTARTANSIASLAREPLENHGDGPGLSDAMRDAERNGDVSVSGRGGKFVELRPLNPAGVRPLLGRQHVGARSHLQPDAPIGSVTNSPARCVKTILMTSDRLRMIHRYQTSV